VARERVCKQPPTNEGLAPPNFFALAFAVDVASTVSARPSPHSHTHAHDHDADTVDHPGATQHCDISRPHDGPRRRTHRGNVCQPLHPTSSQLTPRVGQSEFVADISEQLYETFVSHPEHTINSDGSPAVPGHALIDILHDFADQYDGTALLTPDEERGLTDILVSNPQLQVTPSVILGFIAARAKETASASPSRSEQRGRRSRSGSRAGSREPSVARTPSRPPSRGPLADMSIPSTPSHSALDKRQRTAPLNAGPPSSWSKPTPASRRRKSVDGGGLSDSEVGCDSLHI
jgi:hypothetical protein